MTDVKRGSDKPSCRLINTIFGATVGVVLLTGCGSEINESATVERGGLRYEINSTKPYSGVVINKRSGVVSTYKKGMLHGKQTQYYDNGQVAREGNFKENQQDGKWIEYDSNGKTLDQCEWKNGQKHGKEIQYDRVFTERKKIYECQWKDGKKNGLEVEQTLDMSDGSYKRTIKSNWKNDLRQGEVTVHESGKLIYHAIYEEGREARVIPIPKQVGRGDIDVPGTKIYIPKDRFQNAVTIANREDKKVLRAAIFSAEIDKYLLVHWEREPAADLKKAQDTALKAYLK